MTDRAIQVRDGNDIGADLGELLTRTIRRELWGYDHRVVERACAAVEAALTKALRPRDMR